MPFYVKIIPPVGKLGYLNHNEVVELGAAKKFYSVGLATEEMQRFRRNNPEHKVFLIHSQQLEK